MRMELHLRLLITVALLGIGAAVVGLLSPGGLGSADPVRVVGGASADLYRWVVEVVGGAAVEMDVASDGALVVLGLVVAWVGFGTLQRRDGFGVVGIRRTAGPYPLRSGDAPPGTLARGVPASPPPRWAPAQARWRVRPG
ncbi:hypothetical protein GCM10023334_040310 [Nonomuraea thailandensis]